jgi:hypothetical protein
MDTWNLYGPELKFHLEYLDTAVAKFSCHDVITAVYYKKFVCHRLSVENYVSSRELKDEVGILASIP